MSFAHMHVDKIHSLSPVLSRIEQAEPEVWECCALSTAGFTGPDGGPCSICPVGFYKADMGSGDMHTQAHIGRGLPAATCTVYRGVHASLKRNRNCHAYSTAGPCTQCSANHTTDGEGKAYACSCYDVATGAVPAAVCPPQRSCAASTIDGVHGGAPPARFARLLCCCWTVRLCLLLPAVLDSTLHWFLLRPAAAAAAR